MLDRAENLLHDHYGGREYWDVSTSQRALCMCSWFGSLTVSNSFQPPRLKPWAVPSGLPRPAASCLLLLQDPLLPYDAVFQKRGGLPLPCPHHICRWLGHFSFGLGKGTFCAVSPNVIKHFCLEGSR